MCDQLQMEEILHFFLTIAVVLRETCGWQLIRRHGKNPFWSEGMGTFTNNLGFFGNAEALVYTCMQQTPAGRKR